MAPADDGLGRENQRLLTQAAQFTDGEIARADVDRSRQQSPEQRLAEMARLCRLVPWFRSQWPPAVRRRAQQSAPPPDVLALLERMRRQGGGSVAGR
jgi:hypothetical protein